MTLELMFIDTVGLLGLNGSVGLTARVIERVWFLDIIKSIWWLSSRSNILKVRKGLYINCWTPATGSWCSLYDLKSNTFIVGGCYLNHALVEWVSGGLTPCRQRRPSSRREHVNASSNHTRGSRGLGARAPLAVPRGAGGGHGPRPQALEGAPGQLVGANFKKKIRPRQISKVTSLQCPGLP